MPTTIEVVAPDNIPSSHGAKSLTKVFLAGGITKCKDWQAEVAKAALDHTTNTIIFNPRRRGGFDATIKAHEQIKWEYDYLHRSDIILFWFSPETLNPITLFEYGKALGEIGHNQFRDRIIIVGTDPKYKRREDVLLQTQLACPSLIVRDSLLTVTLDLVLTLKSRMST